VIEADRRHHLDTEQLGGLDPPVACNYTTVRVDQNGVGEAKFTDALRDLLNLRG